MERGSVTQQCDLDQCKHECRDNGARWDLALTAQLARRVAGTSSQTYRPTLPRVLFAATPQEQRSSQENSLTSETSLRDTASMVQRNPWKPGAFARLPWLALIAFICSVIGMSAAAATLVYSDGKTIADWRFQPPTYLAIATVITNIALFYVLKEGANISWWHTATRSTTVGDLHRNYLFGSSFQDALLSGRHINFVALGCIAATVAQINSPLLQRASKAVVEPLFNQLPVQMRLLNTADSSTFFTGYVSGRAYDVSLYSETFGNIVQGFNNNASIPAPDTGCKGICSTTVVGLGFALNCSTYSTPFNLVPQTQDNGSIALGPGTAVDGRQVFESHFKWLINAPSNFTMGITYKSSPDCSGDLQVQNCSLQMAQVRYPVIIDGNASTIALDPHTDIFRDEPIERYSLTSPGISGSNAWAGVWLALQNKYGSQAHLRFTGAVGYTLTSEGNLATQYAVVNGSRADGSASSASTAIGSSCDIYFRSPMTELLSGARNLMFRMSVAAANSTTPLQTVTATQTQQRAVFRTQYAFMAGGIGITLIALLMAAGLFHGYASLGRSMTMSPIETAKAFNAPILAGADSNAPVKQLVKDVGTRSVRYGTAFIAGNTGYSSATEHAPASEIQYTERGRGGVEEAQKVPFVGAQENNMNMRGGTKLHMGASEDIFAPRRGQVFES